MQDIKQQEEIVKQQVYIRPSDLDDAKECWKIAKKAIDKMVSLAVEQEKERIIEAVKNIPTGNHKRADMRDDVLKVINNK